MKDGAVGVMDSTRSVRVLIPSTMSLSSKGHLKLIQGVGMGSVLLGEEGVEETLKLESNVIERAQKESPMPVDSQKVRAWVLYETQD